MKYIVTANDVLTADEYGQLSELGTIVYESKVLPILAIETNNPDTFLYLLFIKSFYPSRVGQLENISIIPPISAQPLRATNCVGWQVKVAVLDSGFNDTSILSDTVDIMGTGTQDDVIHGTIVTKIIHNLAPGAHIIGIKVCNSKHVDEVDVLMGLEAAYFKGARVINCSFGFVKGCDGSCVLCQVIDYLDSNGLLVVAAAGNTGPSEGTIGCPGSSPQALTVGAIDPNKRLADFSARGRHGQCKPDVVSSGFVKYELSTAFGTSFSAPIATGVSASLLQNYPDHNLVKASICQSVIDLGYKRNEQGYGLLDVSKTLEVLKNVKSSSSLQGG